MKKEKEYLIHYKLESMRMIVENNVIIRAFNGEEALKTFREKYGGDGITSRAVVIRMNEI